MFEAERGDVEGDARVDTLVAPVEPLAQDGPQTPLGELVDESMLFGQRDEAGRGNRRQLRVVTGNQRFDQGQMAVVERDLRLVDHVQSLVFERALEASEKPRVRRPAHVTSVAFNSLSIASSRSRRTGFSSGPAMLRPSASPRRKADSSTRRSQPLTMRTG